MTGVRSQGELQLLKWSNSKLLLLAPPPEPDNFSICLEEFKFPQVRPEGCRHIYHQDCLEEWIAKRFREFLSCLSCHHVFKKYFLSKSETEVEVE